MRDERGTVVVIEDHRAQQEVLRAAFEARSQRVFVAGTGAAGLELVDTVNPTLVIIDLGLPDIDGLVLCRQIAEGHGGSLTLENRKDARGCRARLTLPL